MTTPSKLGAPKKNEFATAARDMIFSDDPSREQQGSDDDDLGAIDDSCDADEDMVAKQRSITALRIQKRNSEAGLLQKVIPFHWAPMLTTLSESDIEACVTLENAALFDPRHRATREKVLIRVPRRVLCTRSPRHGITTNPELDRVSNQESRGVLLWPVQHLQTRRRKGLGHGNLEAQPRS